MTNKSVYKLLCQIYPQVIVYDLIQHLLPSRVSIREKMRYCLAELLVCSAPIFSNYNEQNYEKKGYSKVLLINILQRSVTDYNHRFVPLLDKEGVDTIIDIGDSNSMETYYNNEHGCDTYYYETIEELYGWFIDDGVWYQMKYNDDIELTKETVEKVNKGKYPEMSINLPSNKTVMVQYFSDNVETPTSTLSENDKYNSEWRERIFLGDDDSKYDRSQTPPPVFKPYDGYDAYVEDW